ncbi:carboxypeptidase-like regulatory domain-containing protein [Lewinella sp. 4G2]|uniref:carboxypeptidase-like regulatory domain-containing protein n=1 Tax=Lewinella sp. 4G2 TaxID=1803372 RepID=UPI0007B4C1D9|nr:carboxypeptidase-like regulatory domain-containing protein [Lewinella sp. 4G2]OAV43744.1 hypothetical protein A3850_004195 [Lewinella sp. 4G2]
MMCINKQLPSFLALLCLLVSAALTAQVTTCQVVDENGEPVPFVNVYAPASQAGLVTDVDGYFDLFEKFAIEDTLRFSCLSYDDRYLASNDLEPGANCRVTLRSDAIELQNIVVQDERLEFIDSTVGHSEELPLAFYDFRAPGAENGVLVDMDRPMLIDKVDIQFGPVTVDTTVLELNFYEVGEDGQPARYLQNKRIIHQVLGPKLHGAIYSIDLTDERVRTEGPILITLRTLSVADDGQGKLFVGAKMDSDQGLFRTADNEGWEDPGIHPLIEATVRVIE